MLGACRAVDPAVRDFLLGGASTEALGSNNWVVDGTLTALGQAAARQRSRISARGCRRPGISRTSPAATSTSSARRCPARRRSRSDATASSPGARPTSPPTSRICIANSSTPTGTLRGVPRRAGAAHASSRKRSRVKGAAPVGVNVRVTRHGPLVSDAINANNAASAARRRSRRPLEPLAFRWTALDADDTHARRVPEAERGAELDRVHRRAARLRRPVAELRVRRRRRPHRLLRAGTHPASRSRRRLASRAEGWTGAPSGPAGCRSTSCRTSSIRRRTSSSPPTTGRRRRDYPYCSASSGPEPYRAQRIIDLLRGRQRPARRPTTSRASRRTPCRCTRQALLPLLLAHARPQTPRRAAGARPPRGVELRRAAATARRPRFSKRGSCTSRRRSSATSSVRAATRTTRAVFSSSRGFVAAHADRRATSRGATTCERRARRPATTR